jgi:hypothetical protein
MAAQARDWVLMRFLLIQADASRTSADELRKSHKDNSHSLPVSLRYLTIRTQVANLDE